MFDQIPDEDSELMGRVLESAACRGWFPTIVGGIAFVGLFFAIGVLVAFVNGWGMTDKDGALRVLREEGYREITITGYRWFTCDKNDYFHTGFHAVGPGGAYVSGTVCKGMVFKSSTVRID